MKLLMENWKNYIEEETQPAPSFDELSKKMMTSLQSKEKQIQDLGKSGIQKASGGQKSKVMDEVLDPASAALIYAGTVAAIPAILNAISWVQGKRGKLESAKQFEDWYHKWHHSWINMLKKAINVATIGKFSKLEKEKQNKIAEYLFLVIVAYLFGESVLSIVKHFSWLTPIEGILGAIKGGELAKKVTDGIKVILGTTAVAAAATKYSSDLSPTVDTTAPTVDISATQAPTVKLA